MTSPAKMMLVYINETDTFGTTPLYEAVIRRMRQLGIAGATAQAGIMGFGSHVKVHHKRLFGVSDDRPIIVSAVDNEATLRNAVPEIKAMVHEGLVVLVDVEIVPLAEAE